MQLQYISLYLLDALSYVRITLDFDVSSDAHAALSKRGVGCTLTVVNRCPLSSEKCSLPYICMRLLQSKHSEQLVTHRQSTTLPAAHAGSPAAHAENSRFLVC